ncbi:MAG: TraU family protein [Gammaproteobacteria bacterium]|nr:TraU family protein [Gammaproteobacteria bacterium]
MEDSALCKDAKVWGSGLIDKVCWSCFFPAKLFGMSTNAAEDPEGSNSNALCACQDDIGIPHPGFSSSYWAPSRLMELTRVPYCSPSLGGVTLNDNSVMLGSGSSEPGDEDTPPELMFYNYHYYSFPLLAMLDLLVENECNREGMYDFDVLLMSELDPTWNEDELSLLTTPEAVIFSSLPAVVSCIADCAAANITNGFELMFWCVGCWGTSYPFSGYGLDVGSEVTSTSLIGVKALSSLHRRGLARRTMGSDAMCETQIALTLPKDQYKMQMLYPVAEADGSCCIPTDNDGDGDCCHPLGRSTFMWGEWRTLPARDDYIYILWNYNECCIMP